MEVGSLAPDEFEVECQVRKISGDPLNRLAMLQVAVSNEEKNPVLKPFRAHAAARSAPQRELQRCALKIRELREWLTDIKPNEEPAQDHLQSKESRLIHIQARLERLMSSTKSYKAQCKEQLMMVGLVLSGVQTLMQGEDNLDDTLNKIKDVPTNDPADLSTSEDETLPKHIDSSKLNPNVRSQEIGNLSQILSSTNIAREPEPPSVLPSKSSLQFQFSNAISKWKISFSGDSQELPIERFLFRVEHLAETSGVPTTNLVNQLGFLLTGVASNWYWCHIERNSHIGWNKLKQDLLDRFQDRRTEHDIRRAIESRKQHLSEPFRVFYNDILALSLQFRTPLLDDEILHIVRRNMRPGLQVVLADQEIPSITMLVQRCLALEDSWRRTGYEPERLCSRKSIDEVYLNETNNECSDQWKTDDICGIQMARPGTHGRNVNPAAYAGPANRLMSNDNLNICWNCQDIGHRYTDCLQPPKIFCFGCGRAGILKPKCFRCSGNSSTRFPTSGNQTPRLTILSQPNPIIPNTKQNPDLATTSPQPANLK